MPARKGRWENAISGKQLDNVRKETRVVSIVIPRLETDAISDKKDNRPLLHQKQRREPFWNNRKDPVPKFPQGKKVYVSVM